MAIGRVPTSAAMVVIMIGRKRTRQASKMASLRGPAFIALLVQGEVDHHDGVLLDDADQHDDADEGVEAQIDAEDQQGQQGAEAGGGQAGKNGQGVDEALVEDAEHDVDHQDRDQQQDAQALERGLEGLRASLQAGVERGRACSLAFQGLDASTASPSETPGSRLKEIVTEGNWPWWLTVRAWVLRLMRATVSSGTSLPLLARTCSRARMAGSAWNSGATSRMTWYWLVAAVDGGDLARAEGALQGVLHLADAQAERASLSRSMSSVITGLWLRLVFTSTKPGSSRRRHRAGCRSSGKARQVGVLQRVLVLRGW
jgi:hypothetical protein